MPGPTDRSARRYYANRPSSTVRRDAAGNPRPMTNIEVLAASFKRYLRDAFSDQPPGVQTTGPSNLTVGAAGSRVSSGRQRQIDATVRGAVRGNSGDPELP